MNLDLNIEEAENLKKEIRKLKIQVKYLIKNLPKHRISGNFPKLKGTKDSYLLCLTNFEPYKTIFEKIIWEELIL